MDDEDMDDVLREEQDRALDEELANQLHGEGGWGSQSGGLQSDGEEAEAPMEVDESAQGSAHLGAQRLQRSRAGSSGSIREGQGAAADDDAQSDDLNLSSEDEQDEQDEFANIRQSNARRRAPSSDGGSGDGHVDETDSNNGDDDGASSTYTHRLRQGLRQIPGWDPQIMGEGITARPPLFSTGLPGYWVQFSNTGPFPDGVKCRPVRVIDLGFVGSWQQASDAERVCDMAAQTDKVAKARTVATCALMGLLSVGMAKGFVASPNHSELAEARRQDPEEGGSKAERKLNGKVKTYTYCPNATDGDAALAHETAMMFSFVHIAMHNSSGKYVGFKILMLIFDKGFSLDDLVNKVMKENALIKKSGQINGMPEEQRSSRMVQQNISQRSQLDDNNLEATAVMQYRRICSNHDYLKFLKNVGGEGAGQRGRPYYENIARDTPPGCAMHDFAKCPENEYGGRHPIGPTISHNHKRFVPPTENSPGVNVFTAGTLDARGKPIDLHESLIDPRDWYDAFGNFDPPQHVKDSGWCHMCHDPSVTNIMSAPLPHKMHGNVEPEDCLLRIFWDQNKDSNPILVKARERGHVTFEQNRDAVLALFHRMEDTMDPEQQNLARAVLETEMLSNDSLNKTVAEEASLERRAYGKASTNEGEKWVLSVRQPLRDISIEQEKVHAMVNDDDKRARVEISKRDYDVGHGQPIEYDVMGARRDRRERHTEATRATIKLGLQRFAHTFGRAKCVKLIPPGYYDVAKVGLEAAVKEAGEIGNRRAEGGRSLGRKVDPDDPNALIGTANIGFAHGQALVATDLTPFGHHRAFLMRLFSSGVNIAGRDVKLMLECHVHAFEPFQEVSFFLLLCGGPGSGKSMRAKRMMELLPDGWAGMNGGFDHLCGRLVYYDEITSDFASQDSERIEYLKSITMEQRVLNTRSVRTIGSNGLETFTTVVLDSLHYESHLICTNCGPLGLKGDTEPSTNRAALSDRSWAHIVHSNEDHDSADIEFEVQKCSDEVKQQVNRYRVIASLVAYVLIFIKHIPSCRPNLSYANLLCNKWDEILWTEYNLPRPSKRKKIKRRMMMELFAVESAVFEKFGLPESGIDFEDMRPDDNGHLSPFCIEQLVDVVCSLQRCVDHEVILNAWSHSLDHSPATSAHVFQMKTVLAQLHGSELDRRVLVGDPETRAPPAAGPAVPPQGRREPAAPGFDSAFLARMDTQALQQQPPPQPPQQQINHDDPQQDVSAGTSGNPQAAAGPSVSPPPPPTGAPPPSQGRPGTPADWSDRNRTPAVPPNNDRGHPTHYHYPVAAKTMSDSMTRQRAADAAAELATTRELRCELSCRGLTKKIEREGSQHASVTKIMTDCVDKDDKEPKCRLGSTGAVISAKRAAGACMPSASDLLSCGMDMEFLKAIVNGDASTCFNNDDAKIGLRKSGWEYETLPGEIVLKGPANFDFNWAHLSVFAKSSNPEGPTASGAVKQKSLWKNSARIVMGACKNSSGLFSLMATHSMSVESMRDVLFMIAWSPIENKIRIPKKVQTGRWMQTASHGRSGFDINDMRMLSNNRGFEDTKNITSIHPKHMFIEKDGVLQLDPAFVSPASMERPLNSTVGLSLGQKRLDHLTNNRALPVCIMPEGFERGVPIKECEAFNGIYFNKHTASEQAALVLEMGLFLSTVPGIAGGRFSTVPDSFKGTHPNPYHRKDVLDAELEAERQRQREREQEQPPPPQSRQQGQPPPQPPPPPPAAEHMSLVEGIDWSCNTLEDGQLYLADSDDEHEPDGDAVYAEQPELQDSETRSDHSSVEHGVTHPDSADPGVRPQPGATDRASKASVDPTAMVPSLPYEWDQLAMFFSIKMTETLHNDVHAYVDKFRDSYKDVYENERPEVTLAGLPQISIRFPGVVDARSKAMGEEKTKELMPLSCGVPLKQSRYCDVAKHIQSARASKGLTEAVHSFAHGRAIAFNDPEVLEHEAEARGLDSGITLEGNLFARSTWQRFTLSALDARGMRSPEEEARVADQGLCMRLRVRNHRAVDKNRGLGDPVLNRDGERAAKPHTFAAQERRYGKRTLGDTDEDDDLVSESLNCKRRNLEREREMEELEKSMGAVPSV